MNSLELPELDPLTRATSLLALYSFSSGSSFLSAASSSGLIDTWCKSVEILDTWGKSDDSRRRALLHCRSAWHLVGDVCTKLDTLLTLVVSTNLSVFWGWLCDMVCEDDIVPTGDTSTIFSCCSVKTGSSWGFSGWRRDTLDVIKGVLVLIKEDVRRSYQRD